MNVSNNVFGVANAASLDAEDDQFSIFFKNFVQNFRQTSFSEQESPKYPRIALDELVDIYRSNGTLSKQHFSKTGLPYIQYGQIHTGKFLTQDDRYITYIDPQHCSDRTVRAQAGDLLLTGVSEDLEGLCRPLLWQGEEVILSQSIILLKFKSDQINPLYLAYFFKSYDFYCQKYKDAIGVTIHNISVDTLRNMHVTVPPLHIQQAIGKFLLQIEKLALDKDKGLSKELKLRQEQFRLYLELFTSFEQSLFFEPSHQCRNAFEEFATKYLCKLDPSFTPEQLQPFVEVKLEDLCSFGRSNSTFDKSFFSDTGLPYIQYGQIHTGKFATLAYKAITNIDPVHCSKAITAKHNDIIITDVSEDIEGVGKSILWKGEGEVVTSQHCILVTPDTTKVDPAYLAYFFKSYKFFEQKRRITYGSSIFQIYAKDICNCKIILPPLSVQKAIGEFLSKLDNLAHSKDFGIEKEISLRQTQLTFMIDRFFS